MRSSDRKLHIVLRVIIFCLIVLALFQVCNFFIAKENTCTRVMIHEMYNPPEDIDMVFTGSSTTYRHFIPEIWDDTLNMYTFNLGSSSQHPDSTFYLLKELFSVQHPKYCIFSLSGTIFVEPDNPTAYYILSDYFQPSLNKLNYIFHCFDGESIYVGLLPFLRYKTSLSLRLILDNIQTKTSLDYKNYSYNIYDTSIQTYEGRGYVSSTAHADIGHVGKIFFRPFTFEELDTKAVSYIPRISKLCQENDCELIMVVAPLPYAHMAMQENYQLECDFLQDLAEECGVPLFNFSLCRPEFLPLEDDAFYDYIHMSNKGAAAFSTAASQLIADYISGKEIDYDSIFYSSYQELMDASPYVFNAWITQDKDVYTANCTYGNGVTPEYQFSWRDAQESAWQVLQEYGPTETLDKQLVPADAAELRVCVRPVGCTEDYQQWDSVTLVAQ